MGDQQGCSREVTKALGQIRTSRCPRPRIEGSKWLIEQKCIRVRDQGAGQRNPLGLSSRNLRGAPGRKINETELVQPLVGASPSRAAAHAPRAQTECDVVANGQMRKEQIFLEDHPDRSILGGDEGPACIVDDAICDTD